MAVPPIAISILVALPVPIPVIPVIVAIPAIAMLPVMVMIIPTIVPRGRAMATGAIIMTAAQTYAAGGK